MRRKQKQSSLRERDIEAVCSKGMRVSAPDCTQVKASQSPLSVSYKSRASRYIYNIFATEMLDPIHHHNIIYYIELYNFCDKRKSNNFVSDNEHTMCKSGGRGQYFSTLFLAPNTIPILGQYYNI